MALPVEVGGRGVVVRVRGRVREVKGGGRG